MGLDTAAFISYGLTITPDDLDGESGADEPRAALAEAVGVDSDDPDYADGDGDGDASDHLWLDAVASRLLRRKSFGVETCGSYADSAWVLGVRFVCVDGDGSALTEFDPAAVARHVARLKRDRVLQAAFARVRKALPTVGAPSVVCGVMLRGG